MARKRTTGNLAMDSAKIMIVEDCGLNADYYALTLKRVGFEIVAKFKDGESAIEYVKNNPDVTVALMDVQLEGEIDGIDTAITLYNQFGTQCVFISSHGDYQTISRSKSAHPVGYIIKPVSDERLIAEMEAGVLRVQNKQLRHKVKELEKKLEQNPGATIND